MPERAVARALLVQACEESDPEGRFLPHAERERAARESDAPREGIAARHERDEADRGGAAEGAFLVRRAERLAARLERGHASLRAATALATLRPPGLLALGLGLAGGIGMDALGAERRINLLSFPLLGLLAWNFAAYLALGLRGVHRARRPGPVAPGLVAVLARAGLWGVSPRRFWNRAASVEEARWIGASLTRFLSLWRAAAGPLLAARSRRLLHLGAAGFALGVVLSMYASGFAFEYRASWESTFLDAQSVQRLLALVLGPASWLLGAPLPDVAGYAALRAPETGDAAYWIHRWALTSALAIVAPRLVLAAAASWRERRLCAGLSPGLDAPQNLRDTARRRGAGRRAHVVPYSYRPSPGAREALRELLLTLLGNRAEVEVAETVAYGQELPDAAASAATSAAAGGPGSRCTVALFNLAQPPEQEVQGAFLETLKRAAAERGSGAALLVVLDPEPYRRRLEPGDRERRLAERRRAWTRMAEACGLGVATLPEDAQHADQALAEARSALWHAGPQEVA